jgi:hypothetical protein
MRLGVKAAMTPCRRPREDRDLAIQQGGINSRRLSSAFDPTPEIGADADPYLAHHSLAAQSASAATR